MNTTLAAPETISRRSTRPRRNTCDLHPTYQAGCENCQKRTRDTARHRTRLIAYGQWDRGHIDTTPARNHITWLRTHHHMSLRAIAEAAGVTPSGVDLIAAGSRTKAAKFTVDAICGVRPRLATKSLRRVPGHGTARRLQALTAAGYHTDTLAVLLDTTVANVQRWRRLGNKHVSAATHEVVVDLCSRIAGRSGRSAAARRYAARRRWASLADWADINNPASLPRPVGLPDDLVDLFVVKEAAAGRIPFTRLTSAEHPHLYAKWFRFQQSQGRAAGGKPFARAFGATEWQARQLARAAATAPLPVPAANSRTNQRKVA